MIYNVLRKITEPSVTIGSLDVGTSVYLSEGGVDTEYIIVNQGIPSESSLYDESCDGSWLLRKDVYEERAWHSSNSNSYKASTIYSYLNGTFLDLFGAAEKAAIKQVKIPYVNGTGGSAVASGASGLSTKIFLLSGYELGWTTNTDSYFPVDGVKLSYFDAGRSTTANNKRIANLNGSATYWWLRSPITEDTYGVWSVNHVGNCYSASSGASKLRGIRPALVLPKTALFDAETMIFRGDA